MKYLSATDTASNSATYFGHFIWKAEMFAWPEVDGQCVRYSGQRATHLTIKFVGIVSEETKKHSRKLFARKITHVLESEDGMRTDSDLVDEYCQTVWGETHTVIEEWDCDGETFYHHVSEFLTNETPRDGYHFVGNLSSDFWTYKSGRSLNKGSWSDLPKEWEHLH